jgi:hypothetical protein
MGDRCSYLSKQTGWPCRKERGHMGTHVCEAPMPLRVKPSRALASQEQPEPTERVIEDETRMAQAYNRWSAEGFDPKAIGVNWRDSRDSRTAFAAGYRAALHAREPAPLDRERVDSFTIGTLLRAIEHARNNERGQRARAAERPYTDEGINAQHVANAEGFAEGWRRIAEHLTAIREHALTGEAAPTPEREARDG